MKFMRYYGHFEGDQQTYRGADEVKKLREEKDCLLHFRKRVVSAGEVSAAELDAVDKEVLVLIDRAVTKAKADPKPEAADLLTDVYVSYP